MFTNASLPKMKKSVKFVNCKSKRELLRLNYNDRFVHCTIEQLFDVKILIG